ncbi:hypothetical protein ABWK42_06595 [Bacillus sp. JJ927]|uniref:hypothetical protein n=1 Tax=Bacillus sp. JJ927 TaxID=3122976 RepID=UPI0033931C0A
MKLQERIKAYRIPIIGVIGLLAIWFLFFRDSSGGGTLTQKEFENKLKDLSNGKITITDSKSKPFDKGDGTGLYTANWNGFMITSRLEKNGKLSNTYGVITKQAGYMDEISLGQYHDLIQYLIRISNPDLSVDDVQLIVDNELNFNQQIMTGEKHTTSKGGMYYQISGGEKPVNFYMFMIMDEDGYNRIKDKG